MSATQRITIRLHRSLKQKDEQALAALRALHQGDHPEARAALLDALGPDAAALVSAHPDAYGPVTAPKVA